MPQLRHLISEHDRNELLNHRAIAEDNQNRRKVRNRKKLKAVFGK